MKALPPCVRCGIGMVPQGHKAPVGMRVHTGNGHCTACYKSARRGADTAPLGFADCVICHIPMVRNNGQPIPKGARRHGARGLCQACYHIEWRAKKRDLIFVPDADPEPWAPRALCLKCDPETFFRDTPSAVYLAKAVCDRCPVEMLCLQSALDHREPFGVWGGTTADERRRILKRRVA